MNEKLLKNTQRLYELASARCIDGHAWEFETKFLEEVVKECIVVCAKEAEYSQTTMMKFNVGKVLNHFGVEFS